MLRSYAYGGRGQWSTPRLSAAALSSDIEPQPSEATVTLYGRLSSASSVMISSMLSPFSNLPHCTLTRQPFETVSTPINIDARLPLILKSVVMFSQKLSCHRHIAGLSYLGALGN